MSMALTAVVLAVVLFAIGEATGKRAFRQTGLAVLGLLAFATAGYIIYVLHACWHGCGG